MYTRMLAHMLTDMLSQLGKLPDGFKKSKRPKYVRKLQEITSSVLKIIAHLPDLAYKMKEDEAVEDIISVFFGIFNREVVKLGLKEKEVDINYGIQKLAEQWIEETKKKLEEEEDEGYKEYLKHRIEALKWFIEKVAEVTENGTTRSDEAAAGEPTLGSAAD